MNSTELNDENPIHSPSERTNLREGSIDHIFEVLASHNHPFILLGCSALQWMGSLRMISRECDMLVRNDALKSIASALVESGHWDFCDPDPQDPGENLPSTLPDADLVLRRTNAEHESEYRHLILWSESTYHMFVDECPTVQIPDMYPWGNILIEEKWHPALGREDGWWFGPHLHPDTTITNLPERATPPDTLLKRRFRDRRLLNNHSILVPTIPTYLDALIYHKTQYRHKKPSLASESSWQIHQLIRHLYLELPHQQLPLLIELEEYEYMEDYLKSFKRKPRFVYKTAPGSVFEATRVSEWDPTSYPDWCGTMKKTERKD